MLSQRSLFISCCEPGRMPFVFRCKCKWLYLLSSMRSIILPTNGAATAGSPPVIFTRPTLTPLSCKSDIMSISLSTLKADAGGIALAFEQNKQCALQPFVTFTNRFTCGLIRCAASEPKQQSNSLTAIFFPLKSISMLTLYLSLIQIFPTRFLA